MTRMFQAMAVLALLMLPLLSLPADASLITYSTWSANRISVMVMNDTGANPTEIYRFPKFSIGGEFTISPPDPDGSWVAIEDHDLYKVRADGTDVTKVLCEEGTDAAGESYYLLGNPQWSPDGAEILVQTYNWTKDFGYLGLIPASFAVSTDCASPLAPIHLYDWDEQGWAIEGDAAWNDDGSQIALFEVELPTENTRLAILDREAGWAPTVITTTVEILDSVPMSLDWQRGGDLLVFVTKENLGPHQFAWWLNWINVTTGAWGYMTESGSRVAGTGPSWSPDGSQLIFSDDRGNLVKWTYSGSPTEFDGIGYTEVIGSGEDPDWQRDQLAIACGSDLDCDDENPCTDDACIVSTCEHYLVTDGGTRAGCGGECWSGSCEIPECTTDSECADDSDICTVPVCTDAGSAWASCDFDLLPCGSDDGCCPPGCDFTIDVDCPSCLPRGVVCSSDTECCSNGCHPVKDTCK